VLGYPTLDRLLLVVFYEKNYSIVCFGVVWDFGFFDRKSDCLAK
jgi:hypothetical protein